MKRHRRMLEHEAAVGADGGHEAFAIETLRAGDAGEAEHHHRDARDRSHVAIIARE